jgi:hypothetical protein
MHDPKQFGTRRVPRRPPLHGHEPNSADSATPHLISDFALGAL